MLAVLVVSILVFLSLLIGEYLWRKKIVSAEVGRKFVHIISGSAVAFMPFFCSYQYILMLGCGFLVVVTASDRLNIFRSIKRVKRKTYGEYVFAIAIIICSMIAPKDSIFCIAILQLALADGLAAITGSKYGRGHSYRVFGHTKSLIGSLTFLLVSGGIIGMFIILGRIEPSLAVAILPLLLLVIENLFIGGADNLGIPLSVVVFLTSL